MARMDSSTLVRVDRPVGRIELRVTTVTTAFQVAVTAAITIDGSPYWNRAWHRWRG
jgi:hypothetical protein